MKILSVMIPAFLAFSMVAVAEPWTLANITGRAFKNEVIRLPLKVPDGKVKVTEDGKTVPSVVDVFDGERAVFVRISIEPGQSKVYEVTTGEPGADRSDVTVKQDGDFIVLDNGRFSVKVPSKAAGDTPPAPVASIKTGDAWVGRGAWQTDMKSKKFSATVVDDGTVMGRVRLRYDFDGMAGLSGNIPAYAEVDVTLLPGRQYAVIEERHEMSRTSAWYFEPTVGWKAASRSICKPWGSSGFNGGRNKELAGTLKPGQLTYQPPELLLNMFPRWNQHYKDGWFGAVSDENNLVGGLVVLAGRWYWPHDNAIQCRVRDSADAFILHCPTRRGMRYWFLLSGPTTLAEQARGIATSGALDSLDTIIHFIPVRDWPDAGGQYAGYWPMGGHINPTAGIRGEGKGAMSGAGGVAKSIGDLTQIQARFSPNSYGSYWLYWSPENPNFFTDFMKVPIGKACTLREHPRFKEISKMAEQVFHEDLYHSITLPGGAGNECPGYQQYAMKHYLEMAKVCKQYLGFDATQWPRMKAGASYAIHLSQPMGEGKRGSHPGGDTHPGGYVFKDPREFASHFGVEEDATKFKTEELPNFGVVFRNNTGAAKETYLAFKSGPARGHYHGDQLSFHYAPNAMRLAVDHHCSYGPHAGQEHMHNRVAFHTDDMPYANMDGYEHVIAFKTSDKIDVAVGQVESWRLRQVDKFPPQTWHMEYPQVQFKEPLKYRRTIVMVRGTKGDYFVIRDQFAADRELNATFCLHVYGDDAGQKDRVVDFGTLKLFVAKPEKFALSQHNWSHGNGGQEKTAGGRLTVKASAGEFITVMFPGGIPLEVSVLPNGVKVDGDSIVFDGGIDDNDATTYVSAKAAGAELSLTGKDVDIDRPQGEIGLFVPDAGYPFGEIPEWLARQRSKTPDWAPDWAKKIRSLPQ